MKTQRIYELGQILDHPKFGGFCWDVQSFTRNRPREYDFTHFVFSDETYKIPSLEKVWDKPTVSSDDGVAPFNDFPCAEGRVPVFSELAVSSLKEYLEPNGEILKINTRLGAYYAYQTLTVADGILNRKKTVGDPVEKGSPIFRDVTSYSFHNAKIKPLTIFRVREYPSPVFVTSTFRDRVIASGLQGFLFTQVWPTPTAAEKKKEKLKWARGSKIKIDGKSVDYNAETLFLRLPLKAESSSASERKKISTIRQQLADCLRLSTLESEYFGGLAGDDEVDGYFVIYITCPEAVRCYDYLSRNARDLKWHSTVTFVAKTSPIWDDEGIETVLS